MTQTYSVTLLPGDGIGPEILGVTVDILKTVAQQEGFAFNFTEALIGGAAIDAAGSPLPAETLETCRQSDAVLLAAIGGYKWDNLPRKLRPETGLLGLRAGLNLFANLRPAQILPQLVDASSLKREVVLVPVLRAGLGMLDAILQLIPNARVGFIGLKREESTLKANLDRKSTRLNSSHRT